LVSLGYGDITPASGLARALSYFEALIGQFYLAVLVACLVGAFVSQNRSAQ
jgi:voltage-gated potassium channel